METGCYSVFEYSYAFAQSVIMGGRPVTKTEMFCVYVRRKMWLCYCVQKKLICEVYKHCDFYLFYFSFCFTRLVAIFKIKLNLV